LLLEFGIEMDRREGERRVGIGYRNVLKKNMGKN
jgi:hypothetical protein